MSNTMNTTPKLRKIRPVQINTGVAAVALGNIEKLTASQIEALLTNLEHQLLHDFKNPEILDWIVSQEVVVHARRLWKCAAREAEDIDREALWLNWLGKSERGFWKALSVLNQLEKRSKTRAEADVAAQAEHPENYYKPATVLNEERGGAVDLTRMTDVFTWYPPFPTCSDLPDDEAPFPFSFPPYEGGNEGGSVSVQSSPSSVPPYEGGNEGGSASVQPVGGWPDREPSRCVVVSDRVTRQAEGLRVSDAPTQPPQSAPDIVKPGAQPIQSAPDIVKLADATSLESSRSPGPNTGTNPDPGLVNRQLE